MRRALRLALPLALLASPALAHLDPGEHGSFLAGVTHPLVGADHILAMVAVGLWGAALGGAARWALPTSFVAQMGLGFVLALAGLRLPLVEPAILGSVLLLGLAVALRAQPPLLAAASLVGFFGVFHGHAHGAELGGAGAWGFGLGFALSTTLLHAAGLVIAWGYARGREPLVRGLGWATVLGGVWIAAGG